MICTYGRDCSLAGRIARSSNIKVIYQQHMGLGVNKRDFLHTRRFNSLDAWIAPLPSLRDEVLKRTRIKEEKVHCIALGADVQALGKERTKSEARAELQLPPERRYIGVLGRIDPAKGQELLLRTMHRFLQNMDDLSLVIMGEPTKDHTDYGSYVSSLISEYRLEHRVFMRPFANEPRAFFDAVDLCMVPTRSETYGMVTVEALMCGCPVAGTRAGGTPEILMHGAWGELFEPDNDVDCARAIQEIINNYDKYIARSIEIMWLANRRFSFEKECEEIENLLESLMK